MPKGRMGETCSRYGIHLFTLEINPSNRFIQQHRGSEGWSFAVILTRHNKKTSQKESVRMEPHPPYLRPTALEARHWGATYALYRVRADNFSWIPHLLVLKLYDSLVLQWAST